MSEFLRLSEREIRCLEFLATLPEGKGKDAVRRTLRKIQRQVDAVR